jgi:ubiquitin-protein ligase
MNNSLKVCFNQLREYNKDPVDNVILEQDPEDATKVNFTIIGPNDTPWVEYIMFGHVTIPNNYPFVPPVVKFTTKTFHPNIYSDGSVCLSILNSTQDETGYFQQSELWSPVLNLRIIFLCIMNLFHEPNLESPADLDACILYRNDQKKLRQMLRNLDP